MAGYRSGGTSDFDDIFEPRQAGDPAMPATGYRINGTDIASIYAPASVGDPGPAVDYRVGGSDIGPTFAALGTRGDTITLTAEENQLVSGGVHTWVGAGDYIGLDTIGEISGAVKGALVDSLYLYHQSSDDSLRLTIVINGNKTQNFFTTLRARDAVSDGVFIADAVVDAANADTFTYDAGNNNTIWTWIVSFTREPAWIEGNVYTALVTY